MTTVYKQDVLDHPLTQHLLAAVEQAMYGKGQRHGGALTPFMEQPWVHYAKMHGRGFLTGQAAKKLEEAASTRTGDAFTTEVRGAIVYLGMALIGEAIQAELKAATAVQPVPGSYNQPVLQPRPQSRPQSMPQPMPKSKFGSKAP